MRNGPRKNSCGMPSAPVDDSDHVPQFAITVNHQSLYQPRPTKSQAEFRDLQFQMAQRLLPNFTNLTSPAAPVLASRPSQRHGERAHQTCTGRRKTLRISRVPQAAGTIGGMATQKVMIRFDSRRAMSSANRANSKPHDKAHGWWASNLAGRNACEVRAGAERYDEGATRRESGGTDA